MFCPPESIFIQYILQSIIFCNSTQRVELLAKKITELGKRNLLHIFETVPSMAVAGSKCEGLEVHEEAYFRLLMLLHSR